ncbi:MAG: hypothetical protein M3083_03020 [Actinomycetota bacterium]|nr:hypothetical protein [Actinomycetota bacterium]MDQ6949128.1 hypothetical protein [Actinomycetota bacterium]
MTASESLRALLETLGQLKQIFPKDKQTWDDQPIVQLAVERLWITAGNLAEAYRTQEGIGSGVEPWAELAGYRNLLAHALPGDISSDRVFVDAASDLDRISTHVRSLTI